MALIVALVLAVVLTPAAAATARRLDVVDRPGPLKVHRAPVPYLGGVAVLAALAGPVAADRPALLAPLVLAAALGLADDVADLPPRTRLAGEVVIGAVAAAVEPGRGPLGALVTVALVVALLNAVNLLDGLDGLAAGVAAVSAAGFAAVLDGSGRTLALALSGAAAGFLVWNRPPARIYLGDAGSYLIGTALALLAGDALRPGRSAGAAAAGALLLAVPVADTTVAIVRRARARRPLLQGDRGHVYDQLVDRGWSPARTTAVAVAAQAGLAGTALAVRALPGPWAVAVAAVVAAGAAAALLPSFTAPRSWVR